MTKASALSSLDRNCCNVAQIIRVSLLRVNNYARLFFTGVDGNRLRGILRTVGFSLIWFQREQDSNPQTLENELIIIPLSHQYLPRSVQLQRGAGYLVGEKLVVVWVEFSTLVKAVSFQSKGTAWPTHSQL